MLVKYIYIYIYSNYLCTADSSAVAGSTAVAGCTVVVCNTAAGGNTVYDTEV